MIIILIFFEAGGNSLIAIQVLTSIWEIFFAVQIDTIEFYEDPTLQGLAKKNNPKAKRKNGGATTSICSSRRAYTTCWYTEKIIGFCI